MVAPCFYGRISPAFFSPSPPAKPLKDANDRILSRLAFGALHFAQRSLACLSGLSRPPQDGQLCRFSPIAGLALPGANRFCYPAF
jgi:hypothetical protein